MPRRAIYPGSFDPITLGHVDVLRRGSKLFDEVILAVGNNPAKRYRLDLDTRCRLAEEAAAGVSGVRIVPFQGLLVDTCKQLGVDVILRGLRALSDFDTEFRYGLANRDLSGIETMFLLSAPENVYVSSSLVKEIYANGGDVTRLVPGPVLHALEGAYGR